MKRIRSKKQEISRLKTELRAEKKGAKGSKRLKMSESKKMIKIKKQELFQLRNELRTTKEQEIADEPQMGALPDFVIIGAQKCGTTSLYRLLTGHPYVERAATKELHFFNNLFEEGIEWYCRCFPQPRWKDGRRTITGEATGGYLFNPLAPERMAGVVPQARLIALLRNPVDRAYSHYHKAVRKGVETRTFEEAMEAEEARLRGEEDKMLEDRHYNSLEHSSYLARGIYVDQLLRWSKFFSDEQMLVLKSEDFFEHPQETLKIVQDFLGLPYWEPETFEARNRGRYEQEMNQATRRWLEEYFEPHNRRLYEYLGVDFGW